MSNNGQIEGFKIGDTVTRKPVNNFDRSGMKGVVVETKEYNGYYTCKIKWEVKQETGQQHSTIQTKFLINNYGKK